MSNWLQTTIGEQATLQRGIDITKAEQRPGKVPVISSGGVSSHHDTAAVKGPGVVLGRKGVVGSVYYIEEDYWPHDTSLWVKNFHGNHPRFVYYFFRSVAPQIARLDVGSANPTLNRNHVHPMPVDWPPLAEQKAIAAVLGALDDKIELNRRMNATLEAMARALFQSWFVDFDPVRAKLDGRKPTGLDPLLTNYIPNRFEEASIGKTPLGWEVTSLQTTLSVLETGGRPKGGVAGIKSGIPSIGAESIVGVGQFDFGKTKFVPLDFFEKMKKGHIQSHDVLLYKDGGRPGEYEPHVSMFGHGFPFDKCSINEHVYRLRTNQRLSQEYLYFWLTSDLALAEMRMKGTGVAIPGLNSTAVRSLTILVPPLPVVEAFTRHAAPLMNRILANAQESRTLATLLDTLMPKLLSGELVVAK